MKTVYKIIILIVFLSLSSSAVIKSQITGKSITLSTNTTPGKYVARDFISLDPGFNFNISPPTAVQKKIVWAKWYVTSTSSQPYITLNGQTVYGSEISQNTFDELWASIEILVSNLRTVFPSSAGWTIDKFPYSNVYVVLTIQHASNFEIGLPANYTNLELITNYIPATDGTFEARIDNELILDATYPDFQPNINRQLDKTLSVGSLPGTVNVSPSGSANYSMPIELPPGTAGMQPQISVVYNSQAGDGLLGRGFDIGGLSSISRTQKTKYSNSTVSGITLTNADIFAVDGNKLTLTGGSYGGNNSTYGTENETFSRITAYGTAGNGPQWFQVETKDGRIMEYGNSDDSRLEPHGSSTVLVWKLSKVSDRNGNFMTYKYKKENDESVIYKIGYTGNGTSLTPYDSIIFLYEKKADARKVYISEKYLMNSILLRSIKIKNLDQLVRQYNFHYTRDIYSHLSEVELVNSEQEKINSTIFNWGEYNKFITADQYTKNDEPLVYIDGEWVTFPPNDGSQIIMNSGDVDGDGIDDILKIYATTVSPEIYTAVQILHGELNSGGALAMNNQKIYFLPPAVVHDADNASYHSISAVHNINGDATPDIVMPYFKEVGDYVSLEFYIPNIDQLEAVYGRQLLTTTDEMPPYSINDLDNNGLDDFVIVEENGYSQRLSVLMNGSVDWISTSLISSTGNTPQRIIIADFNADGLNDVFIKSEHTARFYKNTTGQIASSSSSNLSLPTDPAFLETGDFNGDGLVDFIVCNKGVYPFWRMLINNGNWTFTQISLPNISVESDGNSKDRLKVMDFNNDGKSDIVVGVSTGNIIFGNFIVSWFKSTGIDMALEKSSISTYGNSIMKFIIGDFNGDARADLIYDGFDCYNNISTASPRVYYSRNFSDGLLNYVVDGYNNKTSLSYLPLTCRKTPDNKDFYTGNFSGSHPLMVVQPPLYCVWQVTSLNANGTSNMTEYSYDEAKVHLEGLGFLGFHQITAQNTVLDRKVLTTNTLDSYYKLAKQETVISTAVSPILNMGSSTVNYATVKQGSNYFSYIASTDELDLSNTSVNTSYTYEKTGTNYNGNVLSKLQKYDNNSNFYIKTEYAQYTAAGYYLPNKPKLITVTRKHPDDASTFVSKVYNTYDAATGRILSTINNYQVSGQDVTTTYEGYNVFGLPGSVTTSATDLTSIVKTYHYESKGRFVDQESDALGITYFEYDPIFGANIKTTDRNGLINKSMYNSWGSLVENFPADSLNSTFKLSWAGPGEGPANALYYSYTTQIGRTWTKAWYDSEGRILKEEALGFNNASVNTNYTYTPKGQLDIKTSYMGGVMTDQVDYSYYNDGRVQSETNLGGKVISYEYTNKVVKTTTDGKTYERDHDGWGNVSSFIEPAPGGTITYKYYSNGKPWKIISPANTTIIMTYDAIGNQKTLIDPDAGTNEYTYDAFGRLTFQKDYKGNEDLIQYDDAGRIDYKQNKLDQIIDYQYVESGNGKNQIAKLLDQNNGSYHMYEYDKLGRLWKTTKHIDATISDIIFEYGYNMGNLTQITYPGNYIIDQEYDDYGNLIKVKNGSNAIWTLSELTTSKMKYSLGSSGMYTQKNFDSNGLMTSCSTKIGANIIQYQYYDFNPVNGQLRSREDRRSSYMFKEQFTFDNLYRLTDWNITKNGVSVRNNNQSYETDFSGNIDHKDGIGQYDYGTTYGPHAVETLTTEADGPVYHAQNITYTDFDKVASIEENDYLLTFTYGPDKQRIKSELKQSDVIKKTIYYGGLYEKTVVPGGETRELLYIHAGDGLAAVYMKSSTTGNNLYYVHKDHLGSIVSLTDGSGVIKEQYNYDPWGRRRNPTTWDYPDVTTPTYLTRGFTGHEHLDEFALINMNGRVYDPDLGMFLSPDNFVQSPTNSQNFNRYTYCLNNPLRYTDPDGELFWIIPNIGWSKSGGLNIGISVGVGVPGGLSAHAGLGYSFGSNDVYGYIGATYAMNTVYASLSSSSGGSVGYTAGLSQFSGLPINTNFLTVGINYNISHNSVSGNMSAWQLDQNGMTFNPSVSAMIFPEQTTNFVRGQGFRNNDAVLSRFVTEGNQQGALDYFNFDGKFNPGQKSKYHQIEDYWGATNLKTGEISYGNRAFENYATLYATYMKESYHSQKILNGLSIKKLPLEVQGLTMDTYLEEIYGYVYAYKKQGLYTGNNIPWSGVTFYQKQLSMFGVSYPTYPARFQWFYKIPRRW